MGNTNIAANQNLFHTPVLANILRQDPPPPEHKQILEGWSKNIASLNKQDNAGQHAAFLQKILVDILGYRPESGNTAYTLKDMTTAGSYFDAAVGQFEKDNERVIALVKLMGSTSLNLDAISDDEQQSLVTLARQQAKNIPGRQFFLLSNLDEIRLYSMMHKRTAYERFSLLKMRDDAAEYQRFYSLLCAESMLSGKTAQWLDESIAAGLQDKLTGKYPTVRDIYGPAQPGVPVDLDDIFVVDKKTYDRLVKEDPKSREILMAFYAGDRLRRWHADSRLHWLIYTPKGEVDIDAYPAIKKYLEPFRERLEKREGDQKWYELDHTESTGASDITALRLGTGRIQPEPGFVLGEKTAQYGNESYYISNADYFLFGLLNSNAVSKLITTITRQMENGMYELLSHQVESLPVPDADGMVRARLGQLAQFCMEKAQDRRDLIRHFHGMIAFNLSPEKLEAKLSDRLLSWFAHDFDTFRSEIIASFGVDIPEKDLQLWSDYLKQEQNNVAGINADLAYAEGELNLVVYKLFELDEDDIALIERG